MIAAAASGRMRARKPAAKSGIHRLEQRHRLFRLHRFVDRDQLRQIVFGCRGGALASSRSAFSSAAFSSSSRVAMCRSAAASGPGLRRRADRRRRPWPRARRSGRGSPSDPASSGRNPPAAAEQSFGISVLRLGSAMAAPVPSASRSPTEPTKADHRPAAGSPRAVASRRSGPLILPGLRTRLRLLRKQHDPVPASAAALGRLRLRPRGTGSSGRSCSEATSSSSRRDADSARSVTPSSDTAELWAILRAFTSDLVMSSTCAESTAIAPPTPFSRSLNRLSRRRQHDAIERRPQRRGKQQDVGGACERYPQFTTNSMTSRSRTRPSPVTSWMRRSICARRRTSAERSSMSCRSTARR